MLVTSIVFSSVAFFFLTKTNFITCAAFHLSSLPNDNVLYCSKLRAIADDKINAIEKIEFVLLVGRKHCGKRRKCWLNLFFLVGRKHCGKRRKCWFPAFSPFPTMFSKVFFLGVVKSRDRAVNSKISRILLLIVFIMSVH